MERLYHPYLAAMVCSVLLCLGEAYAGPLLIEEAAHYRDLGRQHQAKGQIDEAITAYSKAVLSYPEYADVHNDLGIMYEAKGEPASAEAEYRKAVQINPRHGAAHTNLALLYEAQGKIDQAAAHWQERVAIGPAGDPWARQAKESLAKYRLKVPGPPEVAKDRPRQALQAPQPKAPRVEAPADDKAAQARQREKELRQQEVQRSVKQAEALTRKVTVPSEPPAPAAAPVVAKPQAPVVAKPQPVAVVKPAVSTAPVVPISTPREAKMLAEQLAREKDRVRGVMVRELYQRGLILHRQRQYAQAIEQFQRVLTIDPDHRESQQYLREAQAALARGGS